MVTFKIESKMMKRDAIDFGQMEVGELFRRLFFPTFFGLLFGAMFNLVDGVFVGRGVGSDALAAINIAAPMFMIVSGLGMMLGSGATVVASIHLAKKNVKAANINITQSLTTGLLLAVIVTVLAITFPSTVNSIFGGSELLAPYVSEYLLWVAPAMILSIVMYGGMFFIRLDGSPRYAMCVEVVPALLNIFLDWLFVFPLQMGLKGAAMATSISTVVGSAMSLTYLLWLHKTIALYRPKFSRTAIRLWLRNVCYQSKMGLPSMLGELAICCVIIMGNYVFMARLHEDGVAAFSTACYLFPLIFMFGNGIAQSALPIVSYNLGAGKQERVAKAFRISILTALGCGIVTSLLGFFLSHPIVSLFLEPNTTAWQIGISGFPLYALGFVFVSLNLVMIGYYQSIERATASTVFMALRGFLLIIPAFLLLPSVLGDAGLWLAIPAAELLTFLIIAVYGWLNQNTEHQ